MQIAASYCAADWLAELLLFQTILGEPGSAFPMERIVLSRGCLHPLTEAHPHVLVVYYNFAAEEEGPCADSTADL